MKITFNLSSKLRSDKMSEILIRFVANRQSVFRAKSGIFITPDNWDNTTNMPKTNRRAYSDKMECYNVSEKLRNLTNYICGSYHNGCDSHWLSNLISSATWKDNAIIINSEPIYLCDAIKDYLANSKDSNTQDTIPKLCFDRFARFEAWKGYSFTFNDVSNDLMSDFISFMQHEHEYYDNLKDNVRYMSLTHCKPRSLCNNSVSIYYIKLKNIINNIIDCHNIPIRKISLQAPKSIYGTPYYLTAEQRDRLYNAPIYDVRLRMIRDMFIAQCFIGCRYSDLVRLTYNNVVNGCIVYVPQKTRGVSIKNVTVPIHPILRDIMDRYPYNSEGHLFPIQCTTVIFNYYLKRVFEYVDDCNITVVKFNNKEQKEEIRRLSEIAGSHLARRTFVGCLYEKGFRDSDIAVLSGHSEYSKSIFRYRKTSDTMLKTMIDNL